MLSRRTALGLLATTAAGPVPRTGQESFAGGATLLIAGPEDGRLDRVSRQLVPALMRNLPPEAVVGRNLVGGADGVTGANQFDARSEPDGLTLLMVPGEAALAWLSGDPRARFDAGLWVPVLAAATPCVLVGRAPATGQPFRIAAASATGPEMAALLAFDLLTISYVPVFGLGEPAAARDALAQGRVDVVLVHGPEVPVQLAALAADRAGALFRLDGHVAGLAVDPAVAAIPDVNGFARATHRQVPAGPLARAWHSVVAAARLDYALVLPQLTPPAMVAAWRQACGEGASPATPIVAALAPDAAALLELRRWLADRFNWRP